MKNPLFINRVNGWKDFGLNLFLFDRLWGWRVCRGRFHNMRGPNQGSRLR